MTLQPAKTVIKVTEGHGAAGVFPFNFEDLAARAQRYLDNVKAQAAEIVANAQREAVTIRKKAEEEGRRQGLQQAEQIVRRELENKLGSLLPALSAAIKQIEDSRHEFQRVWEKNIVTLACAIAARMVRQQAIQQPEISLPLIQESIQLVASSPLIRIRLHPEDEATLRVRVETIAKELAPVAQAEIIADENITRGGCRVETQFGFLDQQLESQARRIIEELAGDL